LNASPQIGFYYLRAFAASRHRTGAAPVALDQPRLSLDLRNVDKSDRGPSRSAEVVGKPPPPVAQRAAHQAALASVDSEAILYRLARPQPDIKSSRKRSDK
jgi:hypothetical protein